MTNVIVIGHGGYGSAIRSNLEMLVGQIEGFQYLDFNIGEDLNSLQKKIRSAIEKVSGQVLFACDLTGGSPFREASLMASTNKNYCVVAGLNTAGYSEIAYNLDLEPRALAELGIDASKGSMMIFNLTEDET